MVAKTRPNPRLTAIGERKAVCPVAKKISKISYEEMLELSSLGTKVMQPSAVQTAMIYDIPLQVKSTFSERKGTEITSHGCPVFRYHYPVLFIRYCRGM